jgi:hypothetical protein
MTKGDKVLITLLIVIVASCFLLVKAPVKATGKEQVLVEVKNSEVIRFDLTYSEDSMLFPVELEHGTAYVEMKEGRVRILRMSDDLCPLHICSDTGWISKPGQVIVCIPNRIVTSIIGNDSDTEVDVWS